MVDPILLFKLSIAAVTVIILIFAVILPLIKYLKASASHNILDAPLADLPPEDEPEVNIPDDGRSRQEMIEEIRSEAGDAAQVMSKWLRTK